LRRGGYVFPSLDGGRSSFGEDRIPTHDGNITYRPVDKHCGFQADQAPYLGSLQKVRIFWFRGHKNLAIRFRNFLRWQRGNQSRNQAESQGQNCRPEVPLASSGVWRAKESIRQGMLALKPETFQLQTMTVSDAKVTHKITEVLAERHRRDFKRASTSIRKFLILNLMQELILAVVRRNHRHNGLRNSLRS